MHAITPTLKPGAGGDEVANLHEALLALLAEKVIRALVAPNEPSAEQLKVATEKLRQERDANVYGDATRLLVRWFQLQNGLGDGLDGVVEDKTADRLNELLRAMGLLDGNGDGGDGEPGFVVRGRVTGGGPDHRVRVFDVDFRDEQHLGDASIVEGRYELGYRADQFAKSEKGRAD